MYKLQLAMEAPISSTELIEKLGNLADTEVAQQITEGKFEMPDEIDEATAAVLTEIGQLGVEMTSRKVSIIITPEEF